MDELAKLNGDDASTVGSGLEMTIEQCFYCLYGHPNKRTKTKHLQDHTAKKVCGGYISVLASFRRDHIIWLISFT